MKDKTQLDGFELSIGTAIRSTRMFSAYEAIYRAGQMSGGGGPYDPWIERSKAVENLPIAVYCTKPNGKILLANRKFRELLGYESEAEIKKASSLSFYVNPEHRERWKAVVEQKDVEENFQVLWQKVDGTPIKIRNRTRVIRDDSDKVEYYQGVVEAVDDDYAEEMPSRYARFFANVPAACVEVSPAGQISWANHAAVRLLGYPSETELKKSYFESLLRNRDQMRIDKRYRKFQSGCDTSLPFPETITLATRDRGFVPVRVTRFTPETRGENHGALMSFENLSVQSEASAIQQLDCEQLKAYASQFPFSVFVKNRQGQFVFINEAFAKELGKKECEIIGKSDYDFFMPKQAAKYAEDDLFVMNRKCILETIELHMSNYVQVIKLPLHNAKNRVVGVIGAYWPPEKRNLVLSALAHANAS